MLSWWPDTLYSCGICFASASQRLITLIVDIYLWDMITLDQWWGFSTLVEMLLRNLFVRNV